MSQILNKLLDQKLKLEEDIKKVNKNIESNKDIISELLKRIKTIKKAMYNRKKRNKNYNDLSLAISEIKNDISHYKNDAIMLNNRILEFESSKHNILLRMEKIKTDKENTEKNNMKRCVDCNIDVHRASYSRHLKTKRHLEKKEIKPRKIIDKDKKKKQIKMEKSKEMTKSNTNSLIIY